MKVGRYSPHYWSIFVKAVHSLDLLLAVEDVSTRTSQCPGYDLAPGRVPWTTLGSANPADPSWLPELLLVTMDHLRAITRSPSSCERAVSFRHLPSSYLY